MKDAKVRSRIDYGKYYDRALKRAQKYSLILERFISPEGTFPVFGRSIPYRMATMQPLALRRKQCSGTLCIDCGDETYVCQWTQF